GAKADPGLAIDYQRDHYAPRPTSGAPGSGDVGKWGCGMAAAGRKCVRFYAEQVHHFAFSLNPQYVYEQGRYGGVVVRVLYLPGDSATWGKGIAVRNTRAGLAWLGWLCGESGGPAVTDVHRLAGSGTELPMLRM